MNWKHLHFAFHALFCFFRPHTILTNYLVLCLMIDLLNDSASFDDYNIHRVVKTILQYIKRNEFI
jgi:hypothetical protein